MDILTELLAAIPDATGDTRSREAFYADQEIWDTEFDDPMAVSEAVETEKCGRCGHLVDADKIAVTGPYRTCPPCTQIIRN